ncbi:histidinol-phosphate transaminase [Niallia sp. 03133]|uniref:histidinol-phosphate transaminase n=1 Tax=Niallia sp. 03133 TaxID=3458060 RepID=UPI004044E58E
MSNFISNRYRNLKVYEAGEQLGKGYIKLNANESPFPPSPKIAEVLMEQMIDDMRFYGDISFSKLRQKIAERFGLTMKNVAIGNGADDILDLIFRTFFDEGDQIAFPSITYPFYRTYGQSFALYYHEVPVGDDLKIDVEDYISLPYAVVIVNPNAPSGHYLPVKDIERLVKSDLNRLVIIDEAYIDYGGISVAPLVKKYNNLLVVQTFSKSRNLAGARIGFVLGDASLIHDLNGVRGTTNPFAMSMIQEKIACASLDDEEYFVNCVQELIATRSYFTKELRRTGYTVLDSLTNFVLIQPRYVTAKELYEGLKEQKILTRFYKMPRIEQYLRISIGTKEDMDKVLATILQIDVHQPKCIKI